MIANIIAVCSGGLFGVHVYSLVKGIVSGNMATIQYSFQAFGGFAWLAAISLVIDSANGNHPNPGR